MDFEKCILILKGAIQTLNINMYPLQGEANTQSVLDLLTQIDDEIGKTPKPRTNFNKITESVENLAEIIDNYSWCPYFCNSTCDREIECIECIKEWLLKEVE